MVVDKGLVAFAAMATTTIGRGMPSHIVAPPEIQKDAPVIVQYGPQRSATTFQFELLCASACVKLGARSTSCEFVGGMNHEYQFAPGTVVKTHSIAQARGVISRHRNAQFFATFKATNRFARWRDVRDDLAKAWGAEALYVQLFESLGVKGHNIVYEYPLNLTVALADAVAEFMRYWEILRRCCGAQMSGDFRHRLWEKMPKAGTYVPNVPRGVMVWPEGVPYELHRNRSDPSFDNCEIYDIGEVERALMKTTVYETCGRIDQITRISTSDLHFDGTYCERANKATAKYHLNPMDRAYVGLKDPVAVFGEPL